MSENLRLYTTVMFDLEQTLARVPGSSDRLQAATAMPAHDCDALVVQG